MTTIEDIERITEHDYDVPTGYDKLDHDTLEAWIDHATRVLCWTSAFAHLQLKLWDNPQWSAEEELEEETREYFGNVGNVGG